MKHEVFYTYQDALRAKLILGGRIDTEHEDDAIIYVLWYREV